MVDTLALRGLMCRVKKVAMWSDTPAFQKEIDVPNFCKYDGIVFEESNAENLTWQKERFPKLSSMNAVTGKKGQKSSDKPLKVGVFFSGGPASGGHNVICGLFDAIKSLHPQAALIGFKGGPQGLIDNEYIEITQELCEEYKNQGGFDLLGTGRTKVETDEQFEQVAKVMNKERCHGLVVIGGDDSNTNAALLANYFLDNGIDTKVIGVPKTIDGDLRGRGIEISFGFDTACHIYSEMISNIERDSQSAGKYYHMVRLMGRTASNVLLECVLQTHPNLAFISEEVLEKKFSLQDIVDQMVFLVEKRQKKGLNHGVIVFSEGLVEHIPEMRSLIEELNDLLSENKTSEDLSPTHKKLFNSLPKDFQMQLLKDRDAHGNVQVSKIEMEKLLSSLVEEKCSKKPQIVHHFLGYEGRCGYPSSFDASYCYSLGWGAAQLLSQGHTAMMVSVQGLKGPVIDWALHGIPLVSMMSIERRHGKDKPVIEKALVDLNGKVFKLFASMRDSWALEDDYHYVPPRQYAHEEARIELLSS